MELLYATGMRVSELVSPAGAAARGDPRMLLVRGKGGRERMVPLSRPARAALAAWLAERDAAEARRRAGAAAHRVSSFPRAGPAGT
jgi:integrase/recombinase XerD